MFLPYIRDFSESFNRFLKKYNIKLIHKTGNTLKQNLTKVQDKTPINEKTGIIYSIPCKDCSSCYIGQSKRSLNERLYEHKYAFKNFDLQKTTTIEHSLDYNHKIGFEDSRVIAMEKSYKNREIKEAIHILTTENYNRNSGYPLPEIFSAFINSQHSQLKCKGVSRLSASNNPGSMADDDQSC